MFIMFYVANSHQCQRAHAKQAIGNRILSISRIYTNNILHGTKTRCVLLMGILFFFLSFFNFSIVFAIAIERSNE